MVEGYQEYNYSLRMMNVDKALQIACDDIEQVDDEFIKELISLETSKGNEMIREYLCQICSYVVKKPLKCGECETLFCSECITKRLIVDPEKNVDKDCPNCRSAFKSHKMSRIELQSLHELKFECPKCK